MGLRDVTLTQLAYFVRTAELGSMSDAAAELYVAQSAVSSAIASLERALETTLLVRRRGKTMNLTVQGQSLLPRAREILSMIDSVVDEISPRSLSGRLSVACFSTLVPFYMPQILQGMSEEHGEIVLEAQELAASDISRALTERSVDIAITYNIGLDAELIETEMLGSATLYAAVSSTHPLAGREFLRVEDLEPYSMALLDIPVSRDYFLELFRDQRFSPKITFRSASFEAVQSVVAHSDKFTLLNQRPTHALTYTGGTLHRMPVVDAPKPLPVVLAWLRGGVRSRKAAAFAEVCRALFVEPVEAISTE